MEPALDANTVYFEHGGTHQVIALSRETGTVRWAGGIVSGHNAAFAADLIGVLWGSLEVFRRSNGAKQYTFTPVGTVLSGNVVSDGNRFYVLTHNTGHVLALNPQTGAVVWDRNLAGPPTGTNGRGIALAGDHAIVVLRFTRPFQSTTVSDSSIVASVNLADGAVRWRLVLEPTSLQDPWVVAPAVVSGDNAILVTMRHEVMAISVATGAPVWQFDAAFGNPTTGSSGLAACGNSIIVPTGDLGLVALNAQTGAVLWHTPRINVGSLYSVQCLSNRIIAKGSLVSVLNAQSGEALATYPLFTSADLLPSGFYIGSALFDGTSIFAGTTSGYVRFKAP